MLSVLFIDKMDDVHVCGKGKVYFSVMSLITGLERVGRWSYIGCCNYNINPLFDDIL